MDSMDRKVERRRVYDDAPFLCRVARVGSHWWDWFDRRKIFERIISVAILYGTIKITAWAMNFAEHGDRPGIEVAAIIAAVVAPYMALQGAAIAFLLKAKIAA